MIISSQAVVSNMLRDEMVDSSKGLDIDGA